MNILTFFHLVLLGPFEFLIRSVLVLAWKITANYGFSIIIVSFFITGITAPLYYLAERWKMAEKKLQSKMDKDISCIKTHYTGQKRFYLIQTAHRLYGYKWWFSFKTSLGLLLQIPFFFGAYNVLSHFEGLKQVSFLFLSDLSKPDGLLYGINILPFVMTAVNSAYSFYYTRSKTLKGNRQLLLMSLLFLVLLYNSPSALLLYWTMNNVFSFIKGIAFRKFGLEQTMPQEDTKENQTRSIAQEVKLFVTQNKAVCILFVMVLLWYFQVRWLLVFPKTIKYLIASTFFVALILSIVYFFRTKKKNLILLGFLWMLVAIFVFLFFKRSTFGHLYSGNTVKQLVPFFTDLVIAFCLFSLLGNRLSLPHKEKDIKHGIILASSLVVYLLFLTPLSIYISNSLEIALTLSTVLIFLGKVTGIGLVCSLCLFFIFSKKQSAKILLLITFISLIVLVYQTFFKLNVGLLSGFAFQNALSFIQLPIIKGVFDALIISSIGFCAVLIIRTHRNFIPLLAVMLIVPSVLSISLKFKNWQEYIPPIENSDFETLILDAQKRHVFTQDGINVVYFLSDMFNGNYIERMIQEDPSLKKDLAGFTYYPDTLSPSSYTMTSLGPLLGGEPFIPIKLLNDGKTGRETLIEVEHNFFESFQNHGYKGILVSNDLLTAKDYSSFSLENTNQYEIYWKNKYKYPSHTQVSRAPLLVMLSLFNSSPWSTRCLIYDDQSWLVFRGPAMIAINQSYAISQIAHTDLLSELSSVGASENRLFYFHNNLTHDPYGIAKDGMPIVTTYPDEENKSFHSGTSAYYAAKKQIRMLSNWFDWMRSNKVWDNTIIIVFSDHGNLFGDNGLTLPEELNPKKYTTELARANSLLLIKGLHATNPELITDPREMCGYDALSILAYETGLGSSLVSPFTPDPRSINQTRTRYYSAMQGDWDSNLDVDTVPLFTYKVQGSLFDPKSWSIYSVP